MEHSVLTVSRLFYAQVVENSMAITVFVFSRNFDLLHV